MGQDQSSPVDENTPPRTLESRTLDGLAKYIRSGRVKRVVVMAGAGISTSAGIPDFRSPDTGLYANLARLNLPYAEAVFDISFFRQNPAPFYALAQELYPGKYRPTITHSFIRLLHEKNLLHFAFTQNIDCLEREAGVPGELIVEAHGSFARQSCIECHRPYPAENMKEMIKTKDIPYCEDQACLGLVKPEIVFFGEQLPVDFFMNRSKPAEADLVIVMGTSLTVHPFAGLPQMVREGVPRVLINLERAGDLGSRPDDVLLLGDCDDGVRRLAKACGWLEDLEELWAKTAPKGDESEQKPAKSKDEQVEEEVEKLTKEVERTLQLAEEQKRRVMDDGNEEEMEKAATKQQSDAAGSELADRPKQAAGTAETEGEGIQGRDSGGGDPGEQGLNHVFPHLEKKPSL